MIVTFTKDCGIYKKGAVLEVARAKGQQYINGGFAVEGKPVAEVAPEPEPVVEEAPAPKAPA